jgi:hypothetical protein
VADVLRVRTPLPVPVPVTVWSHEPRPSVGHRRGSTRASKRGRSHAIQAMEVPREPVRIVITNQHHDVGYGEEGTFDEDASVAQPQPLQVSSGADSHLRAEDVAEARRGEFQVARERRGFEGSRQTAVHVLDRPDDPRICPRRLHVAGCHFKRSANMLVRSSINVRDPNAGNQGQNHCLNSASPIRVRRHDNGRAGNRARSV